MPDKIIFDYMLGSLRTDGGLTARITGVENATYYVEIFEEVTSTTGTLTLPTGAVVALDQYANDVDAVCRVITTTGQKPLEQFAEDASGNIITVALSGTGNADYTLSGTPTGSQYAVCTIVEISEINLRNVDKNIIIQAEEIQSAGTLNLDTSADGQILFDDNGVMSGNASLTFNKVTGFVNSTGLNLSGLTASQVVYTDASKNLVSVDPASDLYTQYFKLLGRSGGQVAYGGTGSGESVSISGTSHATPGDVLLNPSGGMVGVGTATPSTPLHVSSVAGDTFPFQFQVYGITGGDSHAAISTGLQNSRLDISAADSTSLTPRLSLIGANDATASVRGWAIFDYGTRDATALPTSRFRIRYATSAAFATMAESYGDEGFLFPTGKVGVGISTTAATTAKLHVINNTTTQETLKLKNVASQTSDSLLITDSADAELFSVDSSGNLHSPDSVKHYYGTGDDASVYYDGTYHNIKTNEVAASDLRIHCGTDKTLELQETVWEDLQFQISSGKVGAANNPRWVALTTNTSEYAFDVNDYIDLASNEVHHGWKEGTAGNSHLHLALEAAQNTGANRYAKFTVYIAYVNASSIWTETSLTAELTIPTGTAALTAMYLDLGALTLTGLTIGTQIKCRAKRIAATGGTEYADGVFINQVGCHLENNTIGSRQEGTK